MLGILIIRQIFKNPSLPGHFFIKAGIQRFKTGIRICHRDKYAEKSGSFALASGSYPNYLYIVFNPLKSQL